MKLVTLASLAAFSIVARAADLDLDKALQSEYVYLSSQKENLERQRSQAARAFERRIGENKARVFKLQKDLAQLSAANDEKHEALTALERQKKELQKRGTSLESTYKKASKLLAEVERGLHFDNAKDKVDTPPPADLRLGGLAPLFARSHELLRASTREETYEGFYLDGSARLVQGQVTRMGRIAAFARNQDGNFLLGPSGAGNLKILERAEPGNFYVFDNLAEAARIQRPASFLERLADFGPIAFLALMLAMVAGLFIVLVKI